MVLQNATSSIVNDEIILTYANILFLCVALHI